jgi:hypothetical protein
MINNTLVPTNLSDFKDRLKTSLRQPINQWLGVTLLSLICFWVVLFYLTHKTQAVADAYAEVRVNRIIQNR